MKLFLVSKKNHPISPMFIICYHGTALGILLVLTSCFNTFTRFERNMRRARSRGMRGGPGRMPPFMRGPPGQKFVVSHSTFDPAMVG